jgi:hypothetical protein
MKDINQNVFSIATPNRNYLLQVGTAFAVDSHLQVDNHEDLATWVGGLTDAKKKMQANTHDQSWIREIQQTEVVLLSNITNYSRKRDFYTREAESSLLSNGDGKLGPNDTSNSS